MADRWRRALDPLGRSDPDEERLRDLAARGPVLPDPEPSPRQRVVAGGVAVVVAIASLGIAYTAFRERAPIAPVPIDRATPTSSIGPAGIDPARVCEVPPYDPDIALLVGSEVREVPLAVLGEAGVLPDELSGPATDELRTHLASPAARYAPADGWRVIVATPDLVAFASPADGGYSDWWVTRFERRDGGWALLDDELVDQTLTPAQRGHDLRLSWDGPMTIEAGRWVHALVATNSGAARWSGEGLAAWGLPHVFDPVTGEELGASLAFATGPLSDLDAGGSTRVPLALGGVGTSLSSGTYAVVACVPGLGLASPVGELRVVDGPADVAPHVVTYPSNGSSMEALAHGTLTEQDGCLALGPEDRTELLLLPDGFTVVMRDGSPTLIDPVGEVVARMGDEASFGGGHVPLDWTRLGDDDAPCAGTASGFLAGGPA